MAKARQWFADISRYPVVLIEMERLENYPEAVNGLIKVREVNPNSGCISDLFEKMVPTWARDLHGETEVFTKSEVIALIKKFEQGK